MNFQEALAVMKERKFVTRPEMITNKEYLCFLPGMTSILMIKTIPNINFGNYLFTETDFLANDWEVFTDFHVELEVVPEADAA